MFSRFEPSDEMIKLPDKPDPEVIKLGKEVIKLSDKPPPKPDDDESQLRQAEEAKWEDEFYATRWLPEDSEFENWDAVFQGKHIILAELFWSVNNPEAREAFAEGAVDVDELNIARNNRLMEEFILRPIRHSMMNSGRLATEATIQHWFGTDGGLLKSVEKAWEKLLKKGSSMRNGSKRSKQPIERKQKRRRRVLRKLKTLKRVVERRKLSVECVR